jgi:pentatricopeptide repeat protein
MPLRDVVSWTLLITGYAQLGEANRVFHLLDRMREASQDPNLVTFVGVFNACSHGGLVGTGYMCFKHMVLDIGITPAIEHYSCMADMLGRAGQLEKVVAIVEHMPLHPNRVIWNTILGACRKWGDMEVGGEAFLHALGLDDEDAASYIIMCNIQTDTEMVNQM